MSLIQSVEKNCPQCIQDCLRPMIQFFHKHTNKKQKLEGSGIQHLEEEQFQFSAKYNQEQLQTNLHTKPQKKHSSTEQQMNVKIGLKTEPQQNSLVQSEETFPISSYNFKLNLDPLDQYYQLIEGKTRNIQTYFNQHSQVIVSRRVKSMMTIKSIETNSGFKFIMSYQLPCSYYYYGQLINSDKANNKLCNTIVENRMIEVVHPNLAIYQLKFKKFMLLEPRFFNYVKYHNNSEKSHWQVCISTKSRPSADLTEKQCQIFSIGCFEQNRQHLNINTYLDVDVKSNIRAKKVVHRVCEEMANYIDKLWQYVRQNYQEVDA